MKARIPARRMQTTAPAEVHRRMHDLSYTTGRSIADLLLDGAILVLRYHSVADGLPLPEPPSIATDVTPSTGGRS